jgi:hypothetical protein
MDYLIDCIELCGKSSKSSNAYGSASSDSAKMANQARPVAMEMTMHRAVMMMP